MLFILLALTLLCSSVKGLKTPKQTPDISITVALLPIASESFTISQTQDPLQPRGPHSTAVHISTTTLDAKISAFVSPNTFSTVGSILVVNSSSSVDSLLLGSYADSDVAAHIVPNLLSPTAASNSQITVTSPPTNETPASSTSISVGIDGETTTQNVHSQSLESVKTLAKSVSTSPRPDTTTSMLHLQDPKGKTALTYGTSTSESSPDIEAPTGLIVGTQTFTSNFKSHHNSPLIQTLALDPAVTPGSQTSSAELGPHTSSGKIAHINSPSASVLGTNCKVLPALKIGSKIITADGQNRYILGEKQTLTPDSTTTLGPGTSTAFLALETPVTQTFLVSGINTSLLSPVTATPALPQIPPLLTMSGQTMTPDDLGQYNIDGQILTPSGAVTASGTKISLAPDKSDIVAGTSRETSGSNITAGFRSGPSGTGVQTFKGSAVGARDGLWSSSIVVLVGISALLWL